MNALTRAATAAPARMHGPSLAAALLVMMGGTLYPPLMADATGHADHRLAMALFWAMSAGFVRGVGFVPRFLLWRLLFSGWAVLAALGLALVFKLMH
ncbi:MAG: cyd operon YbgE family protein [Piscinibacter sp.]|uniref:cyd operon YbgE family protein n=1 Tax=Piscinibacter sp. TaxID=1903157 RepID=UPI003D0C1A92